MEERIAKQMLDAFADTRLNSLFVAQLVSMGANAHIDESVKMFIYAYLVLDLQRTDAGANILGEDVLTIQIRNPLIL